ncbi:MAG: hypothetical protein VYD05_12505, partial [Planctomycetota bacterium]|nr:hypothetical protein [Planctomycetota bacterium]
MILKHVPSVRFLAIAAPLFTATSLFAQDEATEKPAFLNDVFANAGTIGILIMVMSVIALALIIENFMSIKREKIAPPDLLDEIEALLDGENFQDAVELCE